MKNKKKIVTGITIISALVFGVALYRAVIYSPTGEIPLPEEASRLPNIERTDLSSYPLNLSIPKIDMETKVQQVGITKIGNMATPNNFTDVGWFKYGALPGETGSAVLAGHVDNGLSLPGVFYNLKNLVIGDDIYVTTAGGAKLHFIVDKIDIYDYDAKDTDVFTRKDGKFLRLITCTGERLAKIKTREKRLVVTAILSEK